MSAREQIELVRKEIIENPQLPKEGQHQRRLGLQHSFANLLTDVVSPINSTCEITFRDFLVELPVGTVLHPAPDLRKNVNRRLHSHAFLGILARMWDFYLYLEETNVERCTGLRELDTGASGAVRLEGDAAGERRAASPLCVERSTPLVVAEVGASSVKDVVNEEPEKDTSDTPPETSMETDPDKLAQILNDVCHQPLQCLALAFDAERFFGLFPERVLLGYAAITEPIINRVFLRFQNWRRPWGLFAVEMRWRLEKLFLQQGRYVEETEIYRYYVDAAEDAQSRKNRLRILAMVKALRHEILGAWHRRADGLDANDDFTLLVDDR